MREFLFDFFTFLSNFWMEHMAWIIILFGFLIFFALLGYVLFNALLDEFKYLKKKFKKYRVNRKV